MYAPVKKTSTQMCDEIDSSHPYKLIEGSSGNQILHYTIDVLAPYASKIITVKTNLLLSENSRSISVKNLDALTQPEPFVESDQKPIITVASTLKATNNDKTVSNIKTWVKGHISETSYSSDPLGALYAYNFRKGDCTEFMNLTMALLRACGIPARGVAGYICPQNMVLKSENYHNWVEYRDGRKWKVVDPMNDNSGNKDNDYIAMKVIDVTDNKDIPHFERFHYDRNLGVVVKMD